MKKGISLIVLVMTIIVIIILAGSVILSLSNNNPIEQANEATYKTDIDAYSSELAMAISGKYVQDFSFNPNNFYAGPWDGIGATTGTVKEFIPSMTKEDAANYVIAQGKLSYIGKDTTKKQWAKSLGVTDGLILWLDGNDFKNSPATTIWSDKSGSGNNATCNSFAYTAVSGSDGSGGVMFDGNSDYAVVNYNFPETLTIEAWGYANMYDGKMLWSFDGTQYNLGPDLYAVANVLSLNTNDHDTNKFTNQTAYPSLNVWHHYVVVFDKAKNLGTFYLDGNFVGTCAYRSPAGPALYIGRYDIPSPGYYWNGGIKGIRVYNRILTPAEILENYNTTK